MKINKLQGKKTLNLKAMNNTQNTSGQHTKIFNKSNPDFIENVVMTITLSTALVISFTSLFMSL